MRLLQQLQELLGLSRKVCPKYEQGGQLTVLGRDTVHIKLKDFPYRVEVYFKKKQGPPPCDPHHHKHKHDKLEWRLERVRVGHNEQYVLHIEWNVHEYREVIWEAFY